MDDAPHGYRETLNLPKTDFPMRGNLPRRERETLDRWREVKLYERIKAARAGAERYLLHDGPPYTNGPLHLGHVLNKGLKDIVLKYKTMAGYATPFVPGFDCHGLPIELHVERDLGEQRATMSKLEFRRRCHEYAAGWMEIQRSGFQRLGIFAEWDRSYSTVQPSYEAAIVRAFAAFAERGYIYRGKKPVLWCPSDATSLAEFEIEYKERTSPSIFVRFPLEGDLGRALDDRLAGKRLSLVIWTTTPWTIPANLAVAVNPSFAYAAVETRGGEEYLIVARDLEASFREACRLRPSATVPIAPDRLAALQGARYQHPLGYAPRQDEAFRVWYGDHVTLEQGTGLVHTAPGHGQEDFALGQKHGLEVFVPIDARGRFTDAVPDLAGMTVQQADPAIIARLAEHGALLSERSATIRHSYPHCWRCKNPVLFQATPQWFIAMDHDDFRGKALREIDATEWIPPWSRNRIYGMIESRPDWCLSRQRSWGVPIPVMFCAGCDQPLMDPAAMRFAADIIEREGSDAWFARPAEELMPARSACAACGSTSFRKDEDIVDVWFESGVSWYAVCAPDPDLGLPADLYLEGSDQHRGWFHSSLLTALGMEGRAPYRAVLTHGFSVDESGKRYSKSEIEKAKREGRKVDYISVEDVNTTSGAEILRLWVASSDFRNDITVSQGIFDQLADAYRKFRNTCRFILGNLYDYDPLRHGLDLATLAGIDRYALRSLDRFVARVKSGYEDYEFHAVFRKLLDYLTLDLSALYLDAVKDRLYSEAADSPTRRAAQATLYQIGRAVTLLAAPILCFTADEVWHHLPRQASDPDSVHLALITDIVPLASEDPDFDQRWERILSYRGLAMKALEQFRAAKNSSRMARIVITPSAADRPALQAHLSELPDLFGSSAVELTAGDADDPSVVAEQAPGQKCERCWKVTEAAGPLCARCQRVLAG